MKKVEQVEVSYVKKSTAGILAAVGLVAGFLIGFWVVPGRSVSSGDIREYTEAALPVAQTVPAVPDAGVLAILEKEAAADPQNARAWVKLGNAYFDAGQYKSAIRAYRKHLELNPDNADVWTDLGIMLRRDGDPKQAIASFDKAISVDPSHQQSRLNKGIIYLHDLNDIDAALHAWEELLKINPDAKTVGGSRVSDMVRELRNTPR